MTQIFDIPRIYSPTAWAAAKVPARKMTTAHFAIGVAISALRAPGVTCRYDERAHGNIVNQILGVFGLDRRSDQADRYHWQLSIMAEGDTGAGAREMVGIDLKALELARDALLKNNTSRWKMRASLAGFVVIKAVDVAKITLTHVVDYLTWYMLGSVENLAKRQSLTSRAINSCFGWGYKQISKQIFSRLHRTANQPVADALMAVARESDFGEGYFEAERPKFARSGPTQARDILVSEPGEERTRHTELTPLQLMTALERRLEMVPVSNSSTVANFVLEARPLNPCTRTDMSAHHATKARCMASSVGPPVRHVYPEGFDAFEGLVVRLHASLMPMP